MRIVAITRVLNEADIIEAFVRHTAAFAMHHFIMDNGSTDDTLRILAALKAEGMNITLQQSKAVSYNVGDVLTALYTEACAKLAPDWVLCLDADEFVDDRHLPGGIFKYLSDIDSGAVSFDCVKIPMVNYDATSRDSAAEMIVPVRMRHRMKPTDIYKIILRGGLVHRHIRIAHGAHGAEIDGYPAQETIQERLWLAHYSERSAYQYIVKFVRGWAKVLATGQAEVERRTSYHYKGPYEMLRNRPGDLLRNAHFMGFKNQRDELVEDPINYRGGALLYTAANDEAMRAVQCLMGFTHELALRQGRLMDEFPEVRAAVRAWEAENDRIF